jgi:cathepsin L
MFKVLALVALTAGAAYGATEQEYQNQFTQWMQLNKKSYGHEEFRMRYRVWRENTNFVENFNGEHSVAMNEYGDLTKAEFARYYLGVRMNAGKAKGPNAKESTGPGPAAPVDTVNWVTKGAVTGVKNQGQCGSCWSFSTTGSTEGCHEISGKSLVGLSEQNLVDCSTSYGNQGCNGGLMTDAMEYIIKNNGIDSEASYPYTATGPNQCQFNRANVAATLSSYTNVQSGDEKDLTSKINSGPVSVAIDASHSSFQFYSGGVYYEPDCSSTQLDHGVLAAGYGTDSGKDFYLVKNSWGASWGLQGYIMMSRGRNNNCGIATMATLPHC